MDMDNPLRIVILLYRFLGPLQPHPLPLQPPAYPKGYPMLRDPNQVDPPDAMRAGKGF
jgi:hypothetical protein